MANFTKGLFRPYNTKELKLPHQGQFCDKIDRDGSCSKAVGVLVRTKSGLSKTGRFLSKTDSVGVGAFSPFPTTLGSNN